MAITVSVFDEFLYRKDKGEIDLDNDVLKAILLVPGFTPNVGTQLGYADISASELPAVNGYTAGGETLTRDGVLVKNTTDHWSILTLQSLTWTASGGDLGGALETFQYLVIYDDTHASNVLICCFDYGTTYNIPDSMSFQPTQTVFKSMQGA